MQQEKHDNWKKHIAPYEKAVTKYSIWQMIHTIGPFLLLWYAAYWSLSLSYWLTLLFAVPAAGFLIRIFIIFHDCCHRSFFKSRAANEIVGTITGILTCCPYDQWRHTHSVHHATSGNLSKRGVGDIWTLTVDEYEASPRWRKLLYRVYRNPFMMFGIGPIYIFLVDYRFNRKRASGKERWNTYITNAGMAALAALLCWAIGWEAFLLVHGPIFWLSGMAGIWLFYVQHQFEDTYYEQEAEWSYVQAAVQGSSFYKLPKLLHWITGNIGFHHVHHLSPRVPNYHLEQVHHAVPLLQQVNGVTLRGSLQALRFRVWNERGKAFISFGDMKRLRAAKKHRTGGSDAEGFRAEPRENVV